MSKGFDELNTNFNMTNTLDFFVNQSLKGIFTCDVVRVINVDEKTLDVIPMVYQVNGDGEIIEQSPIYGIPYARQQAGINGIILKPQVGDMGVVVYARRDISSVISTGKDNVPDTKRVMSENDAIYLCSIGSIMTNPTRFIEFTDNGITITPNTVLTINGDVKVTGTVTASDCISGTISGKNHTHTGVTSGNSNTGKPQ